MAMICQCAWCRRYRITKRDGAVAWAEWPLAFCEEISHGICPDCFQLEAGKLLAATLEMEKLNTADG